LFKRVLTTATKSHQYNFSLCAVGQRDPLKAYLSKGGAVEEEGEEVMSSVSGFSRLISRAEEKVRGLQRDY